MSPRSGWPARIATLAIWPTVQNGAHGRSRAVLALHRGCIRASLGLAKPPSRPHAPTKAGHPPPRPKEGEAPALRACFADSCSKEADALEPRSRTGHPRGFRLAGEPRAGGAEGLAEAPREPARRHGPAR